MKQWLLLFALFTGLSSQEPRHHDNDEGYYKGHRSRLIHYKYADDDDSARHSLELEYSSVFSEVEAYQAAHSGQALTTEVPILIGTLISEIATTLAPGSELPQNPQFPDGRGPAGTGPAAASAFPSQSPLPPPSPSPSAEATPAATPPESANSGPAPVSSSGASNNAPATTPTAAPAPVSSSFDCSSGIDGVSGCSLPSTSALSISDPSATATSSASDTTAASGNTTLAKPTVDPLAADAAGKSPGGLSQKAKIGLGVGLGLGIPLLALAGVAAFLLARSRRKTHVQGPTDQPRAGSQVAYQKLTPSAGRRGSSDGMIGGPDENEIKRGGSLSGAWEYQDEPAGMSAAGGAAVAGAGGAGTGRYGRESSTMKSGVVSPITSVSRTSRNVVTALSTAATTPTQAQAPHDGYEYGAATEVSRPVSPVSPVSAISSISSLARRQSTTGRSARRPSI